MGLKIQTLPLSGNRPIVQKAMGTCLRDSASPEPLLALAKALRVSHHILSIKTESFKLFFHLSCLTNAVVWLLLLQIPRTWSELRTMMSLHRWHPQEMRPPLNLNWTSLAPTPPTMRARPKTKPTETQIRTSPIDLSAAAVTRPTTSTWNALHRDAIHLVKSLSFWKFHT